jgi:ornithine cyclodeaminase
VHQIDTVDLGDVTSGVRSGRGHSEDITVCDLTGTGVQDTAIALLAFRKAEAAGRGTTIEN